jgi:hypothetical protein
VRGLHTGGGQDSSSNIHSVSTQPTCLHACLRGHRLCNRNPGPRPCAQPPTRPGMQAKLPRAMHTTAETGCGSHAGQLQLPGRRMHRTQPPQIDQHGCSTGHLAAEPAASELCFGGKTDRALAIALSLLPPAPCCLPLAKAGLTCSRRSIIPGPQRPQAGTFCGRAFNSKSVG